MFCVRTPTLGRLDTFKNNELQAALFWQCDAMEALPPSQAGPHLLSPHANVPNVRADSEVVASVTSRF